MNKMNHQICFSLSFFNKIRAIPAIRGKDCWPEFNSHLPKFPVRARLVRQLSGLLCRADDCSNWSANLSRFRQFSFRFADPALKRWRLLIRRGCFFFDGAAFIFSPKFALKMRFVRDDMCCGRTRARFRGKRFARRRAEFWRANRFFHQQLNRALFANL